MGRVKSLLMLLMVLGFFFATYNLVSMMMEHKAENYLGSFDGKAMEIRNTNSKYHVAVTATDAAYSQWQCRIMYYWYKKTKDMPGSAMGKFTRILHSGRGDQLMNEIPTFVVDPLPEGLDRVCTFKFLPFQHVILVNSWFNIKFTSPDMHNKTTRYFTSWRKRQW